ncbi:MAG: hypothetical protein JW774_13710 [Candidatus Aureabacteria bacterium]|nr:hypothetical protein [Candidatus Auribacterota bacterium]
MKRDYLVWGGIVFIFIYKLYSVLLSPFNEDELAFVRYAWLMRQGYVPFRDFFDLSFPFFHALVIPFLIFFHDPITAVLGIKIAFLALSFISIILFYQFLIKILPKHVSLNTVLIYSLSYIHFIQNTLIRPPSLSIPLLVMIGYLYIQNKLLNKWLLLVLLTLTSLIDFRACIVIIFVLLLRMKQGAMGLRFIISYCLMLLLTVLGTFFLINVNLFPLLIKILSHIPFRTDQTLYVTLHEWKGEWIILLIFIVIPFIKGGKFKNALRVGVLFLITLHFIFFRLRPYTFGPYVIPFIALIIGWFVASFHKKIQHLFFWGLLSVNFFIQTWNYTHNFYDKDYVHEFHYDMTPAEQKMSMDIIHRALIHKQTVLNLSPFCYDLFNPVCFPLLRFIDDIHHVTRRIQKADEIFDSMLKWLEEANPDFIIYSEKHHRLRIDVEMSIFRNYMRIGKFLYKRKQGHDPVKSSRYEKPSWMNY